jgi:DDE superfamily endonuclease/transposase
MGKHLSEFELGKISAFKQSGLGFKKIANNLKRPLSTIKNALKRMKKHKSYLRQKGSGRPRKTTKREDRRIVRVETNNCFESAFKIGKIVAPSNKISKKTIKRRINEAGIYGYVSAKKPFVNERQRLKRLKCAEEHKNWSEEQWKKVLFSDESSFVLRWKGRQTVWRKKGERFNPKYIQGTIKHDKKIMVWCCFSANGVGHIHRINGILDGKKYKQILIHHMVPSAKKLFGNCEFYFQQDNDPKHTSSEVANYLENKKVNVLTWPPQSPDLNPIENLWKELNFNAKNREPKNEDELFEILSKEWNQLTPEYLNSLVSSMPTRCQLVIDANGMPTKY